MRVEVKAYAKVNLDLRLRGLRSDGFHNVQTVLQSVALADVLSFERVAGPLVLECDNPGVPSGERNLAWRAAVATWRALGRVGEPEGIRIAVRKYIPLQAGLGGGSADAAAVVWASQKIWAQALPTAVEHKVLAGLGADVPFFRQGGTMMGVGRGDELIELPDLPSYATVIVVPSVGVATPEAYRWFDERHPDGAGSDPMAWPATSAVWPSWLPTCVNDFEEVVVERHPEIGACLAALTREGAVLARLSGSGSAVFGLFEVAQDAVAAAQALRRSGLAVIETTTIGRQEAGFDQSSPPAAGGASPTGAASVRPGPRPQA